MLMNSAVRDLWMPGLCLLLLVASIITGFVKLAQGPTLASPLIISILWAFVAAGKLICLVSDILSETRWPEHLNYGRFDPGTTPVIMSILWGCFAVCKLTCLDV